MTDYTEHIDSLPDKTGAQHDQALDEMLRLYRVDLQPNFFSEIMLQKKTVGSTEGDTADLFVPGCMFQAVEPQLVEMVFDWLSERGLADTLYPACCGNILSFSAPEDKTIKKQFAQKGIAELNELKVKRIITSCPNCYYTYRSWAEEARNTIEVRALSEVMLEQGVSIEQGIAADDVAPFDLSGITFSIHDACPDKAQGVFAESVRALFKDLPMKEMEHCRSRTMCCGFGRLLGVCKPKASVFINSRREEEFLETEADVLVNYCFTCANAFNYLAVAGRAAHYLELLFHHQIDWTEAEIRMTEALEKVQRSIEAEKEGVGS